MDYAEEIMPPAAMYRVTGLNPSTFRGHKMRNIYKGFGIIADGEVSAFSVFQITAVKATVRLQTVGVQLQEASKCVASIFPSFQRMVDDARKETTELNESVGQVKDITPGWKAPMHWSLSAPFFGVKVRLDDETEEHWHLMPVDKSQPIQQLVLHDVAIVIDFGRIMNEVVGDLIRGGAMSAEF